MICTYDDERSVVELILAIDIDTGRDQLLGSLEVSPPASYKKIIEVLSQI